MKAYSILKAHRRVATVFYLEQQSSSCWDVGHDWFFVFCCCCLFVFDAYR